MSEFGRTLQKPIEASLSQTPLITISVVSHGHRELVSALLEDLASCPEVASVLITLNVPEAPPNIPKALTDRCKLITNAAPRGFGANHNQAFRHAKTPLFCILNPDIRLPANPFPTLIETLESGNHALVAPAILSPQGELEDSARHLPTPWRLMLKLLGISAGQYRYERNDQPFSPDWVGGMFMLVRSEAYAAINGFDERYFLYYEDVDLCTRLTLAHRSISLCPRAAAVHDARRSSHRDLRFLSWHLSSMVRFFCSSPCRRLWWKKYRTE